MEEREIINKKWISFAQVKLEQDLYNQMHNDWIRKNGCCGGDPNCIICNSLIKPEELNGK